MMFRIKDADRYIIFPVKDSDRRVTVRIVSAGASIDRFEISLAVGEPDYWVFFDASRYRGKILTVQLEGDAGKANLVRSAGKVPCGK